ncbi:hypothetical protein EXIGLDRAFT_698065 [Exidia glandulosa HHB12029]|uniref:C2H2-type domain-containing protein n=1 Tax=Exidia glandulosa HHB12029 TaxID=1314781 RepID=A0A165ZYS6_EXIGL|nr:hypothetical protein EXIGLDRAFT_698065 [Exidia glandulosa HHB12029]
MMLELPPIACIEDTSDYEGYSTNEEIDELLSDTEATFNPQKPSKLLSPTDAGAWRCPHCGTEYEREKSLKHHLPMHKTSAEKKDKCLTCGHVFSNAQNQYQHERRQHKHWYCHKCRTACFGSEVECKTHEAVCASRRPRRK